VPGVTTPEDKAREEIDRLLTQAGWLVCDPGDANIVAHDGVAIREFPLKSGHGEGSLGRGRTSPSACYAQGVKANVLFFDRKLASETPWTKKLWIYDLRTNMHFTLKTNPLKRSDLDEFVALYSPKNRHTRTPTWSDKNPTGRWRAYDYKDLVARDKANLDIFWLRDESLEDSDNLPEPGVIAQEIVEDLEAALEQFREIAEDLKNEKTQ